MGDLKIKVLNYFTVLIALSLYSCSDSQDQTFQKDLESRISNNEPSVPCNVASFSIVNLYFDEMINMPFSFNPNFTGRIGLSYTNSRISQVQGGLKPNPPGSSSLGFYWTNDFIQDISYSGNTITVNSPGMYSKQFIIVNNRLVSQQTTYWLNSDYIVNYCSELVDYQYSGNTIVEKKNNLIRRVFYMENRNLSKVELFFRNGNGDILKKKEYLFSNFDSNLNLLKGKFFINGNFFNAFSRNNFRRIEMNTYDLIDGVYQLDTSQYAYFQHNIPNDMFIQDCNL